MAVNVNNVERKMFKFYEGLCSSSDFTKEIAKVLALGVRTEAIRDVDNNVLEEPLILMSKNWDIVYPAPDASLNFESENLTIEEYKQKIANQVSKISDTVILKTTTTPKELDFDELDDLTVDADSNKSSLTMYLELYKPAYIANPEEYPLDCERKGIIPKLITKKMYENSLKTEHSAEDNIYTICTEENGMLIKQDDQTTGSIELNYSDCDMYVSKINDIYKSTSFSIPTNIGTSTFIDINSIYLAKIKQNDADLYNLILNTLNSNEGIEPKVYSLLDSLTIEITKETDLYVIKFQGTKKLNTYTIPRGTVYKAQHVATGNLIPEFCLNGIYTPIESSLYVSSETQIIFNDNISFEASTEGVLVVRYMYETSGQEPISDRVTLLNNHYILMRLFDNINEEQNGPMDNVYNASGELIQTNSHISPWSKLSWYRDFEEIMVDTIDSDISITNINDGTLLVPLETAGLNADTKMRYWINTNNDRFSLIVMGNPSLDYERDRHLISGCYCGRIDSFDNSINDTAGNFALFTSSSTEPCNTVLNVEKAIYEMQNYNLTKSEVDNDSYNKDDFNDFIKKCPKGVACTGLQEYYIQLADKTYFNREEWPKYVIVNNLGEPVTGLMSAYKREFIVENGKSNVLRLFIDPSHIDFDSSCTIYISYSYYQEKNIITSGVSRDVFGNVIDVDKVKDYGLNTSDGVTSIMMYHTRSKAYYQKHHMLFATTEEYMSKVMYGKSSYTGEYYADRIKVTHGNDGPRGTLSDLLVIDSESLYALDELVINKEFKKDPEQYEETFVFFPITAPYSPLSDSPNARYGLAIKKQEIEPQYTDDMILLKLAMQSLTTFTEHWRNIESNIYPRDTVDECSIYWNIVPNSAWIGDKNTPTDVSPVQLAVVNTSEYQGDLTMPISPVAGVVLNQGAIKGDKTSSYLKISGFTAEDGEIISYGISSTPIDSFGTGAQFKVVLYDGTEENEAFEYNIDGVPYVADIGSEIPANDIKIANASPEKYLILYSVKESIVTEENASEPSKIGTKQYIITKFACIPLKDASKDDNWLLQYPCSFNAYIEGGKGSMMYGKKLVKSISDSVEYSGSIEIPLIPADGYKIGAVTIINAADSSTMQTINTFETITVDGVQYNGIKLDNVSKDLQIKVLFETKA